MQKNTAEAESGFGEGTFDVFWPVFGTPHASTWSSSFCQCVDGTEKGEANPFANPQQTRTVVLVFVPAAAHAMDVDGGK